MYFEKKIVHLTRVSGHFIENLGYDPLNDQSCTILLTIGSFKVNIISTKMHSDTNVVIDVTYTRQRRRVIK